MRLIGLKTCDTCRNARKVLAAAGHDVIYTDVRADGLSEEDIDVILAKFPEKALNKASTTWRGLTDAEKASDPKGLLLAHPTLLKRPVIVDGDWTIGWDKAVQAKWLGEGPAGA